MMYIFYDVGSVRWVRWQSQTSSRIVVKYGKNTCEVLRQKVLEKHKDKDVLEIILFDIFASVKDREVKFLLKEIYNL